jgi:hypothetical protein
VNVEVQRKKHNIPNPYWSDPTIIEKARARRFDRVAKYKLDQAIAKKRATEAELRRLNMPLED